MAIKEVSVSCNGHHLEWNEGLSKTNSEGNNSWSIPAKCGLIWFNALRVEYLNVIFYHSMPNLSYLRYLCLLAHSDVQHILWCVLLFCFSSSLCNLRFFYSYNSFNNTWIVQYLNDQLSGNVISVPWKLRHRKTKNYKILSQ